MRKMTIAMALLCCTTAAPMVTGAMQSEGASLAVSEGDNTVIIEFRDGGQAGSVDSVEDFLGPNGRHLFVAQVDARGDRYFWDLENHSTLQRQGDTYRVAVDMTTLDGVGTHDGQSPPPGEYELVYLEAGGPDAPFWEAGGYSDDDNFNETWSESHIDEWQSLWSPYLSSYSQEYLSTRFSFGEGGVETTTAPPTTTQPPTTTSTAPTTTQTTESPTATAQTTAPPTTTETTVATTVSTAPPTTTEESPSNGSSGSEGVGLEVYGALAFLAVVIIVGLIAVTGGMR